jgi:hypothetical protein
MSSTSSARRRLVGLVVLLAALCAAPVYADVAHTATVGALNIGGIATTLATPSMTCGGSNPLCIVYATWRDSGQTFAGVTCNTGAVTMTVVPGFPKTAASSGVSHTAYYTYTPFTATCTATWNSAPGRIYVTGIVLTGAHQTIGTAIQDTDVQDSNAGLTGTTDLTLTTTAGGMVVDALHIRADETINIEGSQVRQIQQNGTALDTMGISTLVTSGASATVGWTWTTGSNFMHSAIAIAPAAAAAAPPSLFNLLGVSAGPQ